MTTRIDIDKHPEKWRAMRDWLNQNLVCTVTTTWQEPGKFCSSLHYVQVCDGRWQWGAIATAETAEESIVKLFEAVAGRGPLEVSFKRQMVYSETRHLLDGDRRFRINPDTLEISPANREIPPGVPEPELLELAK